MIDTNNKPLLLLIVMNVVLFMVVFWLIGMIMGKDGTTDMQPAAVSEPLPGPVQAEAPAAEPVTVAEPAVETAPQADLSLDESIEQVVSDTDGPAAASEPETVETVRNINVYYDGELIRMEESDNHGNTHVLISNSLKDAARVAPQDAAYVQALQELRQGNRRHVSVTRVTRELAEQVEARRVAQAVDRFNKVDVSDVSPARAQRLSLAEQIDSVVREGRVKPRAADAGYAQASLQDYVKTLDAESAERANEMRTIRVRRGDSLWVIAVRAYGNGFEYPRIYRANPHLKNPDLIREGEILRVPL